MASTRSTGAAEPDASAFVEAQTSLLARGFAEVLRSRTIGVAKEGRDPWYREYAGREMDFTREVLGYVFPGTNISHLWEAQIAILSELFEHQYVSIRGCRSSGKSEVLGEIIVPTFMSVEPSQAILLGPTERQIQDQIWTKTRSAFASALRPLPGEMHALSWRIPEDEQCFAKIIAAKTPENVRGYHAGRRMPVPADLDEADLEEIKRAADVADSGRRRLLIAVDEAHALSEGTYRVLEGMVMASNVFVYLQANPYMDATDTSSYYVRSHHPGSRYRSVRISALSDRRILELGGSADPLTPDLAFESVPEELCDHAWVEEQIAQYGIGDPIVASDVCGRFADGNLASLVIPRRVLEQALRAEPAKDLPKHEGPSVGIDLGISHDKCVAVLLMDGEMIAREEWLPGAGDTKAQVSIAEDIAELLSRWGRAIHAARPEDWGKDIPIPGERVHVDDSGMVGVCDILADNGVFCDRVNFGAGPAGQWYELVGDTLFANQRAEMGWASRRLLQEGIVRVPERFSQVWLQASWVRYMRRARSGGTVMLFEPKDDVRERHGRSPDDLDAFWLACRETGPRAEFFLSSSA